jgi:hypothetical protein
MHKGWSSNTNFENYWLYFLDRVGNRVVFLKIIISMLSIIETLLRNSLLSIKKEPIERNGVGLMKQHCA